MRVTKLTLRNIMGHESYELNTERDFTLVEGLNGQGKSSIIESIRSLVGGGHDATLLRIGATEGEIVLLLDDKTEIRKRITEKGSSLTVRREDVGQISAGQTYLRSLIDNVDPTEMLAERDEARRTQLLLEALPLELDAAELREAIGGTVNVAPADVVGHPLVVIEKVRARVFEERTGVNREAKAKKASIDQLSKSVVDLGEDPAAEIQRLEADAEAVSSTALDTIDSITTELHGELQELTGRYRGEIEDVERQISSLEEQLGKLKGEGRAEEQRMRSGASARMATVREEARVRVTEIKGRLDGLRAGAQARAATENTRRVVAGFREEQAGLEATSEGLTAALERVDALKLGLLKKVPLKGVTIEDGVIHENGVPWPRINKGNQVKIAINLAKLRAKELPLVPIDNIESLDGPTFEAFRTNAPKSGLQFIVTRVRQTADKTPGLEVSGRPAT